MTENEDLDNMIKEAWYEGYTAALHAFEASLEDIKKARIGNSLSLSTIKEMIDISKKLMTQHYKEEFKERILN